MDVGDVEVAALGVGDDTCLADRGEAGALQKALQRRLGAADARAFAFFVRVGLARRNAGDASVRRRRRRESDGAL